MRFGKRRVGGMGKFIIIFYFNMLSISFIVKIAQPSITSQQLVCHLSFFSQPNPSIQYHNLYFNITGGSSREVLEAQYKYSSELSSEMEYTYLSIL